MVPTEANNYELDKKRKHNYFWCLHAEGTNLSHGLSVGSLNFLWQFFCYWVVMVFFFFPSKCCKWKLFQFGPCAILCHDSISCVCISGRNVPPDLDDGTHRKELTIFCHQHPPMILSESWHAKVPRVPCQSYAPLFPHSSEEGCTVDRRQNWNSRVPFSNLQDENRSPNKLFARMCVNLLNKIGGKA